MKHTNPIFASLAALSIVTGTSQAALTVYTPDANTLHLWHMDEAEPGPAAPASGVTGSFNLVPDTGKNSTGLATLGNTGFSGFGTAGDTTAGSSTGFKGSSTSVSSVTGASGAFTFEAMVNVSTISTGQDILSMDNNGGAADRPFLFRIGGGDNLSLINISGTNPGSVAIPTTGPDAFVANEWFHVAATYTGAEGVAGNFQYYWTRVDASRTQASPLGAALTMANDLGGLDSVLGVGNNYRTAGSSNQQNVEGLIDEVRISNIARGAGDFIFVPEPSTALLGALGALCLLRRRR